MAVITFEDIRDIYVKLRQRGFDFLLSKLSPSATSRTKSSFNDTDNITAYWSEVPAVRRRWNKMITDDESMEYEQYLSRLVTPVMPQAKVLSVGSGYCSHELKLAAMNPQWHITCIDFSEKLLQYAAEEARARALCNLSFLAEDIYAYALPEKSFEMVFFHASLHHFKPMDFIVQRVSQLLKDGGVLVLNEYVGPNRMQYSSEQRQAVNEGLAILPEAYKQIYKTKLYKRRYYGSGLWRMVLSDPSECVESARIMPMVHQYFHTKVEKGYGGNLLMPLLKDIAHHFMQDTEESQALLQRLFDLEDAYLTTHPSDFVFGIYEKSMV